MNLSVSAVRAAAKVKTEFSGLAFQNGISSFYLCIRLEILSSTVVPVGEFEYFPDSVITHGTHLQESQKGLWLCGGHRRTGGHRLWWNSGIYAPLELLW